MTQVLFDIHGRDANGDACCSTCGYPFKGADCSNPACDANPAVPESVKIARRAAYEKRKAEEVERERFHQMCLRADEMQRADYKKRHT